MLRSHLMPADFGPVWQMVSWIMTVVDNLPRDWDFLQPACRWNYLLSTGTASQELACGLELIAFPNKISCAANRLSFLGHVTFCKHSDTAQQCAIFNACLLTDQTVLIDLAGNAAFGANKPRIQGRPTDLLGEVSSMCIEPSFVSRSTGNRIACLLAETTRLYARNCPFGDGDDRSYNERSKCSKPDFWSSNAKVSPK